MLFLQVGNDANLACEHQGFDIQIEMARHSSTILDSIKNTMSAQ